MGGTATIGGGLQVPDYVSSCDDLKAKLEDASNSRVIAIEENQIVNCHQVPANTVYVCDVQCEASKTNDSKYIHRWVSNTPTSCGGSSGADAGTSAIADTADARTINVASNKTLLGLGSGSTISGATLYIKGQSNIIIQNLNLQDVNPSMTEAGDTITIDGSDHIWVDHCQFQMVSDGFIDAINSSNAITISWNHFYGINPFSCGGQHNFANTLQDALVTFHHNFYDHTLGCSPKASKKSSDTRMHIFNNYWLDVAYYSIQVGNGAEALIEGNYFFDSNRPYWSVSSCVTDGSCTIAAPTDSNKFGGISANSSENKDVGGTLVALPPYTVQVDTADTVAAAVDAGAGPTL
jgi:pectate lyase